MFLFILLIFILCLIYFLSMVFLQYTRISNIKLQFGMDVTKLYSDDNLIDNAGYFTSTIKNCAMCLYKFSTRFK
ncbi:hypothetical protein CHL78_018330 [Romboutsia weinsteinii]|uniref:Uncharacterized protein n=1 Tax=Romboutsia weinsteinii TaxID=2020949 RepID=A0A371IY43_9FIRM|nr:hypothetical protein [Romboutsia weinsteinii]RDY25403.1 hypothetical protein CHL78_018330 [Romboutsia weinsteinii]